MVLTSNVEFAERPPGPFQGRGREAKSSTLRVMYDTLTQPNLSHIDFLDFPAAIHTCTLIISCTTNNASSNEHMHPEILMKNHHKNTYSFAWYSPAIIPDHDISSCTCIVLLSEANSLSHVEFNIARQRGPLGHEPIILLDLTPADHQICHIGIMHDTLT